MSTTPILRVGLLVFWGFVESDLMSELGFAPEKNKW